MAARADDKVYEALEEFEAESSFIERKKASEMRLQPNGRNPWKI
jgi:hypothetical protein